MLYNEKVTHEIDNQAQIKEKLKQFASRFINDYLANANTVPAEPDWTNTDASLTVSGDERLEDNKEVAAPVCEPQAVPEEKCLGEILDDQDIKKSKADSTFDLDSSESVDLPNYSFPRKMQDSPKQNSSLIKEAVVK